MDSPDVPQMGIVVADEDLTVRVYIGTAYNPDALEDAKRRAVAAFKEAWEFRADKLVEIDATQEKFEQPQASE